MKKLIGIALCFSIFSFKAQAAINLVNSDHKSVTLDTASDQLVVYNLFFSSCKNICPTITQKMKEVHAAAKDKPVKFVSITVDPEHDTPERLKTFQKKLGLSSKNWQFLTGQKDQIFEAMSQLFAVSKPRTFYHSSSIYLVRGTKILGEYSAFKEAEVQILKERLRTL